MEITFARESVLVSARFLTAQGNGLISSASPSDIAGDGEGR